MLHVVTRTLHFLTLNNIDIKIGAIQHFWDEILRILKCTLVSEIRFTNTTNNYRGIFFVCLIMPI
jgi:hypothetical protein